MTTTGQQLKILDVGRFLRIDKIFPTGTLEARKLASGSINFYWRFTHDGKTERQSLGFYDPSASPKSISPTAKGYSVEAARRAAETLAEQHHSNREEGGHAALKQAQRKAKEDAVTAAHQAAEFTLARLLDEYCDYLKSKGRRSHSDARSIFNLHVKTAFPKEASTPANKVPMEAFVDMMHRLQKSGHGRTSNKLRSYVRAAYEVARGSNSNASIPRVFKSFGVKHNPVSETVADAAANKADKNPLTIEEMRLYWRLIKNLDGFRGALLRLHLLTGAQRIEQLVELKTAEIKDNLVLLWDGKGKPGKPARENPIPLTSLAVAALAQCAPQGMYALSTQGGETRVAPTTLSAWAQDAVGDRIANFQAKRLRSGVETLLARAKVSKEVRGRLQSHGVSGVQDSNYNGYDYCDEKLEALEILERWLMETPELEKSKTKTAMNRSSASASRERLM